MSEINDTLRGLVAGAAEHAVNGNDCLLAAATASLVVAMTSDGLVDCADARVYRSIMETMIQSGILRIDRSQLVDL